MAIALTFIITIILVYFLFKERSRSGELNGLFLRTENEVNFLRLEKEKIEKKSEEKINSLQEKLLYFEKQNELLNQAQQQLEKQKQEWTKDKETILFKLSEDLLKKNQEQQQQAASLQQENIKKITENLFKNFENVTQKLGLLDDEVKKSAKLINDTKSALLSPGGAGRTSEITLENILKSSNLLEKESFSAAGDYILQSHFKSLIESQAKRPDVILFLPNDQIVVIDAKSSPHFLEFWNACESGEESIQKEILGKIKDSFRRHLEELKKRDYEGFLSTELSLKKSNDYKLFSVMFLQTEQMLEIIKKADKDFEQKAFEAGIIVATPVVLIHLLSSVKFIIDRSKQEKNIEVLKVEIAKLLDGLVAIVKESSEVGRFVNKALASYNKLTKNLNRATIVSKNIVELGIGGKKSDQIKLLQEFEAKEEEGDEV